MNLKTAILSVIKNRCHISAFLSNGCTSHEKAKTLDELGIKESSKFKKMKSQWVFVNSADNKYYLDLKALEQYRRRKVLLFSIVCSFILLIFLCKIL